MNPQPTRTPTPSPTPTPVALSVQFREHAGYCDAVGAPLYGHLLRGFAEDWDTGGPVREICAGWEAAPRGQVVQLRLLGGLHRLVLRRQAPLLATFYRSAGGQADPAGAWPVARQVLDRYRVRLREELVVAPQTNETGRSAALVAGLLVGCARTGTHRVRLLELGASAGLNLLVAAFRVGGDGWTWGPADSPVDLSGCVRGQLPAAARAVASRGVDVVEARGCDLAPVDPGTPEGRLRLTSFVWPDHVARHARLRAALCLAARAAPRVDAADAAAWLPGALAEPVEGGVLTVVWHSIMRQYVAPEDWAGIEDAIARARERIPVAQVCLESDTAPYDRDPALLVDGDVVGRAPAHGVPVDLAGPA